MLEDLSGPDDNDGGPQLAGPALVPGPRVGRRELETLEEMSRKGAAKFPGATETLFTMETEDGEEIWDPPVAPDWIDEGKRWQQIMRWPAEPTIQEAEAFQLYARRALLAEWWPALKSARAADEAASPQGRADRALKPAGRPDTAGRPNGPPAPSQRVPGR